MTFDFDRPINRIGTHSLKWDGLPARYGMAPEGKVSMWVADMDFAAPPAVTEALQTAVTHGVHGYYGDPESYLSAIQGWMSRRHGWEIEKSWIITTAGIVNGVNMAIQAFCRPGDGVIIQSPIYHPFAPSIRNNGCHVVNNQLRYEDGRYHMDLDALAKQVDAKTRMMLLCSPHNPTGRVWSRDELAALAAFCMERDILIVSDEIHHDLVFDGPHTIFHSLGEDIANNTIMFTSASKTFNLAGGHAGNAIISNPTLRRKFNRQLERCGLGGGNRFGYIMTEAAYNHGEEWLGALKTYLQGNRDLVDAEIAARLPGVKSVHLDSTYLSWLDFNGTGMEQAEIVRRFQDVAGVVCNHGPSFGAGGEGFMRLNFACSRELVQDGLNRIADAFADLQ
ncbi:MAG: MalY/PatB family protein [Pikeienuella sp.]